MARRLRLAIAGVALHVVQRGMSRHACFFGDGDRFVYLETLRVLAAETGCAVHAYCLMTNHAHLLVTPGTDTACGRMMKQLGQRYVQYVNRRYGRSGSLWEGRFRSCLVDDEAYVLACYRYVELNPVRAALVAHPRLYPWSSYRINAEGEPSDWVVAHAAYRRLAASASARAHAYRLLVQEGCPERCVEAIRVATHGGYALRTVPGSDPIPTGV